MKSICAGVVAALMFVAVPVASQTLTEEQIAAAITLGQSRTAGSVPVGNRSAGTHQVFIAGPFGRIVDAAAKAAREYRPFGRADVTDEMLSPILIVFVVPNKPLQLDGHWLPLDPVHVIIRPRDALDLKWVIRPLRKTAFTQDWANLFGTKVGTSGLIAEFALERIPRSDFEIVISHASGPDQVAYVLPTKRAMARLPK
jgi:hypothetical protein